MRALRVKLLFFTVSALLPCACAGSSPKLEQPVGETHTYASSMGDVRPKGVDTPFAAIGVIVHRDVRGPCGLANEPPQPPRYDVQSGRLRAHGEDVLKNIAACIQSGKLDDATLTVIGRTDARGSAPYDDQLGLYRANAVRDYLLGLGVAGAKLAAESRGAQDAQGRDEATWALDRNVEVRITGGPLRRAAEPAKER